MHDVVCDSSHVFCPAIVLRICFNGALRKQHILFFFRNFIVISLSSLLSSFTMFSNFILLFDVRLTLFPLSSLSLCLVLLCFFSSSVWLFSRCSPLLLSWSLIRIAAVRVLMFVQVRFGGTHACLGHVSDSQLLTVDACFVFERCRFSHILWFPTRR